MLRAPRGRRYVGVLVVATLAVGLAVAAPAIADVNEITVARFDDPVGTETLVLRLECPDLCQLCDGRSHEACDRIRSCTEPSRRSMASAASRSGRHHVGVGCHGELRVAEDLHHHPRWHVLRKQEGCASVPQVVEANAANPCLGDQLIKKAVQIARLDHRAGSRGEDQAGVDPGWSKSKGFGSLICAVGSEYLRRGRGKRNCATRLIRLWRTEHKTHLG
jgi:hypothetical protein